MAVIKKDNSYMEFPLQISRQYGAPIDKYSIFYDLPTAQSYATSNPLAYVGQIIVVVDESGSTATAYIIKDTAGTLEEVGGSTAPMLFVDDQSEMLALEDIEAGQQVYRSDTHTVWIYKGTDPSNIANWVESASENETVWQGTKNRVNFYEVTASTYAGIDSKDSNTLYVVTDAQKIYKGTVDVTSSVVFVSAFPEVENAFVNKLYINSTTLECKATSDNASWVTASPGYLTDGSNWADADSNKLATIGLIKKGLAEFIASMGAGDADKVVLSTAEGGVKRSTAVIGGATLTGAADTVATEQAVMDAISWKSL